MRYHSVRTLYRAKTRARKSALPQASIFFLLSFALLAFVYQNSISTSTSSSTSSSPASSQHFSHLLKPSVRSSSGYGNLCTRENNIFSKKASLAFLVPGVVFCFVGLALVTDDYFVSTLELICQALNLSEDVAGATFMAAGSSTPEFFASMLGVFLSKDEVGIGTIVGSAVFNLLVIIGLSAALAGAVLQLDWRPLMRDSFFYVVSIVLLLVFTIGTSKGRIDWWEGLILILTYVFYVLFMAFGNKPYMAWTAKWAQPSQCGSTQLDVEQGQATSSEPTTSQPTLAANNAQSTSIGPHGKRSYRDLTPRTRLKVAQYAVIATRRLVSTSSSSERTSSGAEEPPSPPTAPERVHPTILGLELPNSVSGWIFFPLTFPWRLAFRVTIVDCAVEGREKWWPITFIMSIVWITAISFVMVEAARISGCLLNIPAAVMGLTVLAAGTSVPDALASISVARDGAGDMAVSNAIGSNVFDILLGLGLPWFLGDLILEQEISIPVEPLTVVVVPIIILFAIMIVFVLMLIAFRWKMRPLLGYLLFGVYLIFITYSLLDVFVFKEKTGGS